MHHMNHRLGIARVRDPSPGAAPSPQLMRALTRVRGRIVELEVLTQELVVLREQSAALQEVIGTPARQRVRATAALAACAEPSTASRGAA